MCTWFGKPRVRLENKYNGQDDLHTHLARWMPADGKQPTWMCMNSMLRGMVNKPMLGGAYADGFYSSKNMTLKLL